MMAGKLKFIGKFEKVGDLGDIIGPYPPTRFADLPCQVCGKLRSEHGRMNGTPVCPGSDVYFSDLPDDRHRYFAVAGLAARWLKLSMQE